jgi:hypothetical protein
MKTFIKILIVCLLIIGCSKIESTTCKDCYSNYYDSLDVYKQTIFFTICNDEYPFDELKEGWHPVYDDNGKIVGHSFTTCKFQK